MKKFQEIVVEENLKELIKVAFNSDLNVFGAWGYSKPLATVIEGNNDDSHIELQFTLATMRAYLEMNMTLSEDERYGAINLKEVSREKIDKYEKVIYEISAIKEVEYKVLIDDYKENFEKDDFDMTQHFEKRKEATLKRDVTHWFKVTPR